MLLPSPPPPLQPHAPFLFSSPSPPVCCSLPPQPADTRGEGGGTAGGEGRRGDAQGQGAALAEVWVT
eukprot:354376-Chlamydomonas_euryale.AAC.6